MPKITNFAFCESVVVDSITPEAHKFYQTLEATAGKLSFSILFSISGFTAIDNHSVQAIFSDPKGEKITGTEKFIIEKDDPSEEGKQLLTGISIGVEFTDVIFQGQGLYKMELFFDDELIGDFYLPVLAERGSDE